ncbi:hypothetical protein EZJ49_11420 [Bdellovibrio bacteriovorus]|uniref:hypothetical protein n=1 Tax=Bdellovibrio bacteriovorus TaxID=959 RepID=UPI0021CED2C7|nr:hypothetical protein [Bdellovibrio bacteriovorus]UXR63681.1 hypothetical protein EZJ49_11420 [Bdellovibrio bacteriovorus]
MSYVILTLLLIQAQAAPLKSVEDFFKESQTAFEKASKETTFAKKVPALQELEKSFEFTLNQYEKAHPTEGNDQEQNVARLFYTMEPAFELAKMKDKSKKDCARKKQDVLTGDNQNEDSPANRKVKEALRWIELLCK